MYIKPLIGFFKTMENGGMGRGRALYAQPLFETHRLKGENRARKRKGVVEG